MKRAAGFLLCAGCMFLVTNPLTALEAPDPAQQPGAPAPAERQMQKFDYRIIATNKTSTMMKELNQAAEAGYRFESAMGGETAFGGNETVAVLSRPVGDDGKPRFEYKLLATTRTSTMEKEMQEAGSAGFLYRGQTVYSTTFGGKEVVVILERDLAAPLQKYEYRLLATSRTSTMEKELREAGEAGYEFMGITVGKTAMGGNEIVSILHRVLEP